MIVENTYTVFHKYLFQIESSLKTTKEVQSQIYEKK